MECGALGYTFVAAEVDRRICIVIFSNVTRIRDFRNHRDGSLQQQLEHALASDSTNAHGE